jgi:hypothetical protein
MSIHTDNLNLEPLCWGKCTFWYNRDTKNFEVYGSPLAKYNFRLYSVGGIWVAEMWEPGAANPVLVLSGLSIFRGWSLRELLGLVTVLHSLDTHVDVFEKFEETDRNSIVLCAHEQLDIVPMWVAELERN